MFGSALKAAWSVADAGARLTAAAVATGSKIVGQIPVAAAYIENGIAAVGQVPGDIARASALLSANARVDATEWKNWMDVKVASAASTVLPGIDVASIKSSGEKALQQAEADRNSVLDTQAKRQESIRQADQARLENAKNLRQEIEKAGAIAAAGIAKLPVVGAVLALVGADLVRSAFDKIADQFTGKKVGSVAESCPAQSTAAQLENDIQRRQDLVDAARQQAASLPPAQAAPLNAAADQLENSVKASENLIFAADAYQPGSMSLPPGWKLLDTKALQSQLKMDDNILHPVGSGFSASIYENPDTQPPQYVVAFKGTTSLEDWENNIEQDLGIQSDYYNRAIELATQVKQSLPEGASLSFTGHSLGGGLASAAALTTGLPATTFNPAGLNPATVPFTQPEANSLINAYQVDGEILTSVQAYGAEPAVGTTHTIPARPGDGIIDRHLTDSVMYGMETDGASAEAQVQSLMEQPVTSGAW